MSHTNGSERQPTGLETVLRAFANTFKGSAFSPAAAAAARRPSRIQPAVVGGAADLDDLLDKLQRPGVSASERITAAGVVRASIDESAVSSIPEIWYAARDLIAPVQQVECRRAGLRLMKSCIGHDERSVGARISYYKAIIKHSNLEDFDLQLDCLRTLTNDGRDLLDLNQSGYPLPHVLWSWLKRLAAEAQEVRIGRKKDITLPWGTSMTENFHAMMRYIINTLKYNMAIYEEADLEVILQEAVAIGRKTSDIEDVGLICDLINTVMVYGIIPIDALSSILEILCGISITVESLSSKAWDSLLNISKSHLGNNTVSYLCQILESTNRKEVNSNTMRGAARFLRRLFVQSALGDPSSTEGTGTSTAIIRELDIPIDRLFRAYRKSLDIDSVRHSLEVCTCIYSLISSAPSRDLIPYEVWDSKDVSPLEILYKVSKQSLVQNRHQRKSSVSGIVASVTGDSKDTAAGQILECFSDCFILMADLLNKKQFKGPNEVIIDFFIDMRPLLDEATALVVVDHFASMHYCNPLSASWITNTQTLLNSFYFDSKWGAPVRIRVLNIVRDIYILGSEDAEQQQVVADLIQDVFMLLSEDIDEATCTELLDLFIFIGQDCSYALFTSIAKIAMRQFVDPKLQAKTAAKTTVSNFTPSAGNSDKSQNPWQEQQSRGATKCQLIARAIAKLFAYSFKSLPRRSRYLYFNLVAICQRTINNPLSFIEAARVLVRIRSTVTDNIMFCEPTDIHPIGVSTMSAWSAGEEVDYLKPYLNKPSPVLKRLVPGRELDGGESEPAAIEGSTVGNKEYEIDATVLLDVIANVFEYGSDWEVYSYVCTYFPAQLTSIQLFQGCHGELLRLRRFFCDQITNSRLPPTIILPNDVSKHDIMVVTIHCLTRLIPYSDVFSKSDYDGVVQALIRGLVSWERTAVPCIHAFVVCCYECPLSVKKYLGQIFAKFQTKITTALSGPHILELLLSLSRLPWMTDNFTQDEYKQVFGMAFTYIKHANDLARKSQTEGQERIMSQYLLALAYSSIASWFLTVKLSNRRFLATFITRNLILADGDSKVIDEQSLATMDLISRFAYSDVDLSLQTASNMMNTNSDISKKSWLYGKSVVTIETDRYSGDSRLIVRRPTLTAIFDVKPDEKMIPRWLQQLQQQQRLKKSQATGTIFTPSYYLLQLFVPNDFLSRVNPIPLGDDAATTRALGAIDRAPVVDFHKVGVLYIAPGQSSEQDILRNSSGSRAYRRFLSRLGYLIRLKGNRSVYTGGLDTEMDIDGEFAYAWSDKITQMIFHTTTMMPAPANPDDVAISSKKRHIGNNYVSVFFDESGLPFRFDTIKSQFNFVNIVITPYGEAPGSAAVFDEQPDSAKEEDNPKSFSSMRYYQVRSYRPVGVVELLATSQVKIVSEKSLPVFVRNLAIVASKFATVYHSDGQYISNWRYRLREINKLQDKALATSREEAERQRQQLEGSGTIEPEEKESRGNGSGGQVASSNADVGLSFLDQLTGNSGANGVNSPSFDGESAGTASNLFVPEIGKDDNDMPLLQTLDFSKFT